MFAEELAALCTASPSLGTWGTDIFASSSAAIPPPPAEGPFLVIVETGGRSVERTQNSIVVPAWVRPSGQVSARAASYAAARAMARNAWWRMQGIRNQDLVSVPMSPVPVITSVLNLATVTTLKPHSLLSGFRIRVAGAAQSAYNGDFTITVTGLLTFTYPIVGSPASPATGTILIRQIVRYRDLFTLQEPFDMGTTTGRAKVGFNVAAVKHPS